METIGLESITPEAIQAAIAKEQKRQLIERIFEELADENDNLESEISEAEMKVAIELGLTGESAVAIAENLSLSPRTVHTHLSNIYIKTGCKSKALVQAAIGQKLLEMICE